MNVVSDQVQEYTFSRSGGLAYELETDVTEMVDVGLDGSVEVISHSVPGELFDVAASPEGERLALATEVPGEPDQVWIVDRVQGSHRRLTVGDGDNFRPTWHPNGERVAFVSNREGGRALWERPADASEPARLLLRTDRDVQEFDWITATDYVFREGYGDAGTLRDLYTGSTESEERREFVATPFDDLAPTASPRGDWIAYVSTESGRDEVYLRPWPGPGPVVPISASGGSEPAWDPDGSTVYYRSAADSMVAARLAFGGGSVRVTGHENLFSTRRYLNDRNNRAYDVRPDGRGFVMIRLPATRRIVVVTDWFREVREASGMN